MITELSKNYNSPLSLFAPYAPASFRTAWESLPKELTHRLIQNGESFLHFDYPSLTASDFMEFTKNGNRSHYEDKQFLRRTALDALVLAECAEHKGRFLEDIINGIYLICEENAWQLPAHNSYIRDTPQFPLPDVTRPIIDLFAAETASVLAVAEYLLRDELKAVSPFLSKMVNQNLEERIFGPYLKEHFWWMGDGKSHMNNWTVWCTQNVLLAAFTRPLSPDRQKKILEKACLSMDYFLEEYGEDGCCDEGAQYYRHAGLCLFNCLEILNGITQGAFQPAYETEKVKNIAAYILNVHVDGIYYVNFADCSPVAGRCGAREFLFGKRTKNQDLMAFAASDYRNSSDPLMTEEHNLFYRLQTIFTYEEMTAFPEKADIFHKDLWYESTGLFLVRDEHLVLAVKAGDNDDSHNHNDTGSFTIYKDGKPFLIDVGVETYTKKTFSPDRYDIWTMQSCYHNLPTFFDNDQKIVQKAGPDCKAEKVSYQLGTSDCSISMDIKEAYKEPKIHSYVRTAVLEKGKQITISDHYDGSLSSPVLSLMFYEEPELSGNRVTAGNGSLVIDGAASIEKERIPITDERLKTAWQHDIYRLLITMEKQTLTLTIQ